MKPALFPNLAALFAPTDEQAMWCVQTQDDAQAFAQLVQRWQGPIRGLCARMIGDTHRGEDLAQETFARLFARRNDYQPSGKFSTYLWRIAVNLCLDELRRVKRRAETLRDREDNDESSVLERLADGAPLPDAHLAAQESGERVRLALEQLSESYRTVLVLRHYENLKFREIADVLGVPEGTVKSRMAEGLAQMARLLRREASPGAPAQPNRFRKDERLLI